MCGEQFVSPLLYLMCIGSPPRVRGTARAGRRNASRVGITPACAGNSPPRWAWSATPQDHPRVCGEQKSSKARRYGAYGSPPRVRGTVNISFVSEGTSGSPPRVRGTALRALPCGGLKRITPACAGNRNEKRVIAFLRWDHPRVCGEQTKGGGFLFCQSGSPPRVRGTAICKLSG